MATKKMYRCLNLESGTISLVDYVYSGYVSLNEVVIDYDDKLTEEYRDMIIKAIDKRIQTINAEIFVLKEKQKQLLAITHNKTFSEGDSAYEFQPKGSENDTPF